MGGEKFQKLQSDPPLQLSTKEYCLFSCSFSPSYYISQYYGCFSLAGCPLPYVAGTTLFFLFSSLYCFYAVTVTIFDFTSGHPVVPTFSIYPHSHISSTLILYNHISAHRKYGFFRNIIQKIS